MKKGTKKSSMVEKVIASCKRQCNSFNTGKVILEKLELPKEVVDAFYYDDQIYMSIPLLPTPTVRCLTDEERKVVKVLERRHNVKIIHAIQNVNRTGALLVTYLCVKQGITKGEVALFEEPVYDNGSRYFKIMCITLYPSKEIPSNSYCGGDTVEIAVIDRKTALVKSK